MLTTKWRQVSLVKWQLEIVGYAVVGAIKISDVKPNMIWWSAVVMDDCRVDVCSGPIVGYAPTIDKAKLIVETLVDATDTLAGNDAALK